MTESILFVGNKSASSADLETTQKQLQQKGKVTFEQIDRIESISLQEEFSSIVSGVVAPQCYHHTTKTISKFFNSLKPNGSILIAEPCFLHAFDQQQANKLNLPKRTESMLENDLICTGFINVKKVSSAPLAKQLVELWLKEYWNESSDLIINNLVLTTFFAQKPSYSVGSGAKLSFKSKPKSKPQVWAVSGGDEDLEDEDALLDKSDLVIPDTKPGCAPKKKACKDCTCGRAEEESKAAENITIVESKTSSCGSCYLGDAFRCSSCPYLGLPAFKPGDKVVLDLKDDL